MNHNWKKKLQKISKTYSEGNYPKINHNSKKYSVLKKVLILCAMISMVSIIYINMITYNGTMWAFISIGGILYFWILLKHALNKKKNVAAKICIQTLTISLLIALIDYSIAGSGWSVNFVIPWLMITANITILALIFLNRMKWKYYIYYQLVIVILGFIPIILFLLNISNVMWPAIISGVVSFILLIGSFFFSDKEVKNILKRKLHI